MAGKIIAAGAAFAGIGVALGAFGAHGLKDRLTPDLLEIYQTAVQYQFYHSFGLILLGLFVAQRGEVSGAGAAAWAFSIGILLFSGSLYVLALTGAKWLGAITPLGGLAFLVGWGLFVWAAIKS
ncbi:MAG: DUF423 domain-containing protein [Candidatus Binatia bacterium]|nr:DUF423 domain-containing protein [Candidatus Binatia bacterium]